MKRFVLLVSAVALSIAAFAQSSQELSAEDYYRKAEEHKQRALMLQEEAKLDAEVITAGDGTTRMRAANRRNSRYYIIKKEWREYEELRAMGDAMANASKKSDAQKQKDLKELKEILGIKDEPQDTIQSAPKQ